MRIIFVLTMFLATGLARADDEEAARVHFEAGTRFYEQEKWDEAVSAFTRALELAPLAARGEIYWNIARSNERAGHIREAIAGYTRYLSFHLPETDARETARHVDELYARIRAQTSPPPRREPPATKVLRPRVRIAAPRPRLDPIPEPSGWLFGRRYTWVAGGTSAVLGIGAGIAWLLTTGSYYELANTCGQKKLGCSSSDVDGVRNGVLATNVLLVGAGLALAAAAALFIIEGDLDGETQRSLASSGKLSFSW